MTEPTTSAAAQPPCIDAAAARPESEPTPPQLIKWAYWIFFTTIAVVSFVVLIAAVRFRPLSGEATIDRWGQAGDFFGGMLNPVLGLCTVFLLVLGLLLQRHELGETSQALKIANEQARKQSFEQSLFAWLGNYHSLLANVQENGLTGRAVLTKWHEMYFAPFVVFDHYLIRTEGATAGGAWTKRRFAEFRSGIADGSEPRSSAENLLSTAIACYSHLYDSKRADLDALFRTLFRLFMWIHDSALTKEERWHYVALVRAQLSWVEQVYLYFNGLISAGAPVNWLVNSYALFDNLPVESNALLEFLQHNFSPERPPAHIPSLTAWPYEARAFNSDLARTARGIKKSARLDDRDDSERR